MKCALMVLILLGSLSVKSQDLISRTAPVDRKAKTLSVDSPYSTPSLKEDNINLDDICLPIIIDDTKGWEWIYEEEYQYTRDTYPYRIDYYKYASHPQYKRISGRMYDSNGKVVHADILVDKENCSSRIDEDVDEEMFRQAFIADYNSNKYNFKKENAKAQQYVKQKLGLTSSQSKGVVSEAGFWYLEQLKKDHSADFINILKCERLNNLSFKITYGNAENEETATYKVSIVSDGKFKSHASVTKLPLEKIDWNQYYRLGLVERHNQGNISDSQIVNDKSLEYHKVKKGETLESISKKVGIRKADLCKLNLLSSGAILRPGQILKYYPSYKSVSHSEEVEYVETVEDVEKHKSFVTENNLTSSYEDDNTDKVFQVVDQMPSFPGGPSALSQYLGSNLKYPAVAEENGIQGRVLCKFVIEKDGSISNVRTIKSVDPSLDKEAIRLISSMPKWIPGKHKGHNIRVEYVYPVTFRLR